MKKNVCLFLVILLLAGCLSPAAAAGEPPLPSFIYDLSCGGAHEAMAQTGDVIEVTFTILRTDSDASYYANALQNYISFDEDFFEFVDASCSRSMGYAGLRKSLTGHLIFMTDMMDTLRFPLVFGTFRLRVIGASGEGWVRNGSEMLLGRGSVETAISSADLCVRIPKADPKAEISGFTSENASGILRNEGDAAASVIGILTGYDDTGRMLASDLFSGILPAGGSVPLSVRAEGIASVKLFLLDGESGQPLCAPLLRSGMITECTSRRAAAVFRNAENRAASVTGILAAYDEAGRMLASGLFSGILSAGDSVPLSVSAEGIASVKLFLLDGESGQPLCAPLSQTAGE